MTLEGRCVCSKLQYSAKLDSADDARTSLCRKRTFGTNYGLTTKVSSRSLCLRRNGTRSHLLESEPNGTGSRSPWKASPTRKASPRGSTFKQDNGVVREFCDTCGACVCEYGEQADDEFRYVVWETFDEPDKVPPKGEFFCSRREGWMSEIEGGISSGR